MNSSAQAATLAAAPSYVAEYDAIKATMEKYEQGVRQGNSAVMKEGFHDAATFYGYFQGQLFAGPIQILFDVTDKNGPAPNVRMRLVNVDVVGTIASVRIEMDNYTGALAGESGARLSDLFQLIKVGASWKISQKSFHWH
jgi:putative lumazine-binding protein